MHLLDNSVRSMGYVSQEKSLVFIVARCSTVAVDRRQFEQVRAKITKSEFKVYLLVLVPVTLQWILRDLFSYSRFRSFTSFIFIYWLTRCHGVWLAYAFLYIYIYIYIYKPILPTQCYHRFALHSTFSRLFLHERLLVSRSTDKASPT